MGKLLFLLSACVLLANAAPAPQENPTGEKSKFTLLKAKDETAANWPSFEIGDSAAAPDDENEPDEGGKSAQDAQIYQALEFIINKIIGDSADHDSISYSDGDYAAATEGKKSPASLQRDSEDVDYAPPLQQYAREESRSPMKDQMSKTATNNKENADNEEPTDDNATHDAVAEMEEDDAEDEEFRAYLEYRKMKQDFESQVRHRLSGKNAKGKDAAEDEDKLSRTKRSLVDGLDSPAKRKRSIVEPDGVYVSAEEADYLQRLVQKLAEENDRADNLVSYLENEDNSSEDGSDYPDEQAYEQDYSDVPIVPKGNRLSIHTGYFPRDFVGAFRNENRYSELA